MLLTSAAFSYCDACPKPAMLEVWSGRGPCTLHIFRAGLTMASQATADSSNPASKGPKPLVPPDEKFSQRYSPHHEFPLSSVTSFTLHFLVIAFLALAVVFAPRLGCLMSNENPLPLDAVQLNPGGGGDPRGTGPGRGDTPEGRQEEAITKPNETP